MTSRIPRWAMAALAAVMLLISAIYTQSYVGRVALHDDQVEGCMRGTLDRSDNAKGWRTAQAARQAAYDRDGQLIDLRSSRRYAMIAASLESRTRPTLAGRRAFCATAYPAVSVLPWRG